MRSRHLTAPSAPRKCQRGQALAEFTIAAAFFLIPLFLMIPLLGKFMDMKATTIQAARYAAWERTAWYGSSDWVVGQKSDTEIQSEVQQRFFAHAPTSPLTSTDRTLSSAVDGKELWHDQAGAPMLSTYSAGAGRTQTPGTMDAFLSGVQKIVDVIDTVLGTKFKLDMQSLYTSTVELNTANTAAISRVTNAAASGFTAPNFVMSQVLVANGWSANGPDFVKAQTEGLAVLSLAQRDPVKTVMNIVQNVVGTFVEELSPSSLNLGGEILPDYVPPDRLAAAPAAAPAPRQTAAERRDATAAQQRDGAVALADRVKAKIEDLNASITDTQSSVTSCESVRAIELGANACYWSSPDPDKTGSRFMLASYTPNTRSDSSLDPGKIGGQFMLAYHTKKCPGDSAWNYEQSPARSRGPGASLTPIYDANVACNAGLDQKIANLQAKLNDPDLRLAKTKSDEQLAANPSLANDTVFMRQRTEALAAIASFQAKIDDLQRRKDAISAPREN